MAKIKIWRSDALFILRCLFCLKMADKEEEEMIAEKKLNK